MTRPVITFAALLLLVWSCSTGEDATRPAADSVSRAMQRIRADSMKAHNQWLIVLPDSDYTGEYIDKYPTGLVKFRGQYRFGKRHGHWLSFYPDGKLWSEMEYDKGKRTGINVTYFATGIKRYSGWYRNDEKDSTWIFYDEGGKVAQTVVYKNGRLVGQSGAK